jgi:hypothetical protein
MGRSLSLLPVVTAWCTYDRSVGGHSHEGTTPCGARVPVPRRAPLCRLCGRDRPPAVRQHQGGACPRWPQTRLRGSPNEGWRRLLARAGSDDPGPPVTSTNSVFPMPNTAGWWGTRASLRDTRRRRTEPMTQSGFTAWCGDKASPLAAPPDRPGKRGGGAACYMAVVVVGLGGRRSRLDRADKTGLPAEARTRLPTLDRGPCKHIAALVALRNNQLI